MEKSSPQRRILPNLNPSTLQPLFAKMQTAKGISLANALAGGGGGALSAGAGQPRHRRLITDQEMLATTFTSPPGAGGAGTFKARRVNFTPKEVDVLLKSVRTHRDLVLYGVAGGRGWSNAWVNIATTVSQADKIHRSESDVRKKWTYLKWEAKNTSKPGRDATSRAVLNILKSHDDEANAPAQGTREHYDELAHLVPAQTGRSSGQGQQTQPAPTPGPTPAQAGATRRVPMKILAPKPKSPQPPPPPPEVCLRWNSYHSNMQATFPALLTSQRYVDVTLACEGSSIQCHKLILSACSSYFDDLLSQNPCQHPIVLMKDLKFWEIQALVDFMYRGEVNVSQDKLPSLLAAAEALQIKGLAGPASVPGPSAHDQPDDGMNPVLDDFLADHVDIGNNVMAALGVAQPPIRRVRRRRVLTPAPNVEPSVPAKPATSANAVGSANTGTNANQNLGANVSPGQQQRSVLAGRKRKIEPLPQPMRIKLEPVDDPGTEEDEDRFTIDTSAEDLEQADNSTTGRDNIFEDDISPLLPEVVMAPDPVVN